MHSRQLQSHNCRINNYYHYHCAMMFEQSANWQPQWKKINMKNRAYDWLVLFIGVIQLDKRNILFLRIFFVHLHHFTTTGVSVWLCIADDRTELSSRAWWTMTNVQWRTFHFYLVRNINPDGYDIDNYPERPNFFYTYLHKARIDYIQRTAQHTCDHWSKDHIWDVFDSLYFARQFCHTMERAINLWQ